MLSPLRRIARLLVLVCVIASGFGPSQAPATRAAEPRDSEMARTEVRALRKLHLVRPDLIPYPIAYEVCC